MTLPPASTNSHYEIVAMVALALAVVLGIAVAVLGLQLARLRRRWSELLTDVDRGNLERLLYDHLRSRVAMEEQVDHLRQRLEVLERKMPHSKRFLGMVRFDAFEDVGGEQSFALALYDEEGNGAVLSSLVGRQDLRVYCKQLVGGRAERSLTTEEEQAIELAAANRAKPRVG